MGTYDSGGHALYIGASGTITFSSATNFSTSYNDSESDHSFEMGDVITIGTPSVYVGRFEINLMAGSTVLLPVFVQSGSDRTFILFPQGFDRNDFVFPPSLNLNDLDTGNHPACFLGDTWIALEHGDTQICNVEIGDLVQTESGDQVPIKWVGRQKVSRQRHGHYMQPVRIRAGALGGGLPHSDLTVTADHGMVLNGYVINASALVNGDTIDFVPMAELEDSFTVYHIETEGHDMILANGAPSETFIDAAGRSVFDNHQEYLALYGTDRIMTEMSRPRISSARLLPQSVKVRLGIGTGIKLAVKPA